MWEQAMSFTDFVSRYQLARSEGLVLRYLTDAYRTLRQTVPEAHHSPELDEIIDWLGETVRQTDSSLLDEWEALVDPAAALDRLDRRGTEAAAPPRPLTATPAFRVMVRNALWRRVELCAHDDLDGLVALEQASAGRTDPPAEVGMTRAAWDAALEDYFAEHDDVLLDADARGPDLFRVTEGEGRWQVVQTLHDPEGHHDWVVEAYVDLAASDETGEAVVLATAMRRL